MSRVIKCIPVTVITLYAEGVRAIVRACLWRDFFDPSKTRDKQFHSYRWRLLRAQHHLHLAIFGMALFKRALLTPSPHIPSPQRALTPLAEE